MILPLKNKENFDKKKTLGNFLFSRVFGGRNRARTCDPRDVNTVLYQLSHATLGVLVPVIRSNLTTGSVH